MVTGIGIKTSMLSNSPTQSMFKCFNYFPPLANIGNKHALKRFLQHALMNIYSYACRLDVCVYVGLKLSVALSFFSCVYPSTTIITHVRMYVSLYVILLSTVMHV